MDLGRPIKELEITPAEEPVPVQEPTVAPEREREEEEVPA
jgi:hypothetical protein